MVRWIACAALAAIMVSCGGGGLSKEDLIAQADAICAEMDRRIEEIAEPESLEEVQTFVDQVLPIADDGLRRLRALEPPADDRAEVERIWGEFGTGLDAVREMRNAAVAGDEQAFGAAFQRVQSTSEEGNRLAGAYGFDDCAED